MPDLGDRSTAQTVAQWLARLQEEQGSKRLGKAGSRLTQLISLEPHFASYASVSEVAARTSLHSSSVTRVSQALGFDGWPALRSALREVYISSPIEPKPGTFAMAVTDETAPALQNIHALEDASAQEAISKLADTVRLSNRILVVGSGLAAAPGAALSHLGTLAGLDVRLGMQSPTTQLTLASNLGRGDCVIGINIWRMTRSLYETLKVAKSRGAITCLITDIPGSRLTDTVDHVLHVPSATGTTAPSVAAMTLAAEIIVQRAAGNQGRSRARVVEELWDRAELIDHHD